MPSVATTCSVRGSTRARCTWSIARHSLSVQLGWNVPTLALASLVPSQPACLNPTRNVAHTAPPYTARCEEESPRGTVAVTLLVAGSTLKSLPSALCTHTDPSPTATLCAPPSGEF